MVTKEKPLHGPYIKPSDRRWALRAAARALREARLYGDFDLHRATDAQRMAVKELEKNLRLEGKPRRRVRGKPYDRL